MSACRLSSENYCDDIVEAALAVVRAEDDVICVLCGGGPELGRLRRRVADEALADRVFLPGDVAHADVLSLRGVAAVNLCLLAGHSLIEACAAGRPVVAYDVEWHGELVRDGVTGFLVSEGDVGGVVHRVRRLLGDERLADTLGRQGRALAESKFSLPAVNRLKADVYRELKCA
jgi:glycosyltransferase involved in cell wall biosynthesis